MMSTTERFVAIIVQRSAKGYSPFTILSNVALDAITDEVIGDGVLASLCEAVNKMKNLWLPCL